MGSNRKFQAEVDRVLKKISEGLDAFDDTWDKVQSASSQSQKDKWEGDLKKEIKKLQRLREQVKTWATSNSEIRDKEPLLKSRRDVETRMERFKEFERELKTKAYSREGLMKSSRLTAEEQQIEDMKVWLSERIDELKELQEITDANMESLSTNKRGSKDVEKVTELQKRLDLFNWHMEKLELIVRALENEVVAVEDVESIKDELEYFIEIVRDDEPDEYPMDYEMYDALNLDDKMAQKIVVVTADSIATEGKPTEKPKKKKENKKEKKSKKELEADQLLEQQKQRQAALVQQAATQKAKEGQDKQRDNEETKRLQAVGSSSHTPQGQVSGTEVEQDSDSQKGSDTMTRPVQAKRRTLSEKEKDPKRATAARSEDPQQQQENDGSAFVPASPQKTDQDHVLPNQKAQQPPIQRQAKDTDGSNTLDYQTGTASEAPIQFLPLDLQKRLSLLDSSLYQCPRPVDSAPVGLPPFSKSSSPAIPRFPSVSRLPLDSTEMLAKFDLDTLFYLFFFRQGTPFQLIAAQELKRRDWRFHKKYRTWFRRHQEPTAEAKDHEIGTFAYFDFEQNWCQRVQSNFKFDYKYLD